MAEEKNRVVKRSVCPHDCPDTCGLMVHLEDGRVTRVTGDPGHPITRGFICNKVQNYPRRLYSENRVLYPMLRTGRKGEGSFKRISWDEAIKTICEKLDDISVKYGPEAILPYSYAGTMGILNNASMDRRFFHRLGASLLSRTICSTAGKEGYRYTTGAGFGADPEGIPHAKLVITWAGNPINNNKHLIPLIEDAKKNGAKFVNINTHRTPLDKSADMSLQPLPGTDAALALGLMHVIIGEGLYDRAFVRNHAYGFEHLRERVREYPLAKVEKITGVPSDIIVRLARTYAALKPSFLRAGYGFQRQSNGGMAMRTISCLPALVGAWGNLGGGFLYGNGGAFKLNSEALERRDLIRGNPREVNMIRLGRALKEERPPIHALFVYNSNPAAVAPNQNLVIAGLSREDLFTVVHEQAFTDTTRYADVVLPATTFLEHTDIYTSYFHLYLQMAEPVIPPLGECKSNVEAFSLLARGMGFTEDCFSDTPYDLISQALDTDHPFLEGITLDILREKGCARLKTPSNPFVPFEEGGFPTPSGKVEFYSHVMERNGYDPVPDYLPPAESREGNPELYKRFPISLINASAKHFLNSTFGDVPSAIEKEKRPLIEMNRADAAKRGISDGDRVRVWNERGECALYASVGDTVPTGVAMAYKTWWPGKSPGGGNVNRLTSDRSADMGGGPTFYTNLVQIEKVFD